MEKQNQTLQAEIYKKLTQVPKGKVITYKELAESCNTKAHRFVGSCMKNNLDPINIPCYRVVLSNGKVGNYSSKGGASTKIKKLEKDGVVVINGRIDLKVYGYKF